MLRTPLVTFVLGLSILGSDRLDCASVEIPFTLHAGYLLVVEGAIGTKSGQVLIVDTGAGRTIVDQSVSRTLGLQTKAARLRALGKPMDVEETRLSALALGDYGLGPHDVLVADLSATARVMQLARLDGIIGIDALGRGTLVIDYERRRISFGAPVSMPMRVRLKEHPVFPVVSARADGMRVDLIVDTGASDVVLVGPAARRGSGPADTAVLSQITGAATVSRILLKELRIGSWATRDLPAATARHDVPGTVDTDGVLPLRVLGARAVQLDFVRREMGWRF